MAVWAFRSAAVTGLRSNVSPTTIRPKRSFRSARSLERQRIAMISEAGVMSNPLSRGTPSVRPPRPMTMFRNARSFISIVRRQVIRRGSMPSVLPWCTWLSSMAASRLCAAVMAWKSPVKCRLISSDGSNVALPPPVAPPFIPKTGPSDGSRVHERAFFPMLKSVCARPTVTVVLPSPADVEKWRLRG